MDTEQQRDLLSRLADGEDVSIETEVTIKATISVNANQRHVGPIQATIFFRTDESDEILFSAPIEKTRYVKIDNTWQAENIPLLVPDLESIPGIEQNTEWITTGHSY